MKNKANKKQPPTIITAAKWLAIGYCLGAVAQPVLDFLGTALKERHAKKQ